MATSENIFINSQHNLEKKKFLRFIKKYNYFKYPETEKYMKLIKDGFLKKDIGVMKEYNHFVIAKWKDRKVLVVKNTQTNKFSKMIILENCYNMLQTVHLNLHHGSASVMNEFLITEYQIPYRWLIFFVEICKYCQGNTIQHKTNQQQSHESKAKQQKSRQSNTNQKQSDENNTNQLQSCQSNINQQLVSKTIDSQLYGAEMCINSITISNEDIVKFLIYVDRASHYVLLRPLRTEEEDEIAFELLKIFVDFEPPKIFGIPNDMYIKMSNVISRLRDALPHLSLVLHYKSYSNMVAVTMAYILRECLGSVEDLDCRTWPIQLGSIQWKMNLQHHGVFDSKFVEKLALTSQYHALFGVKVKDSHAGMKYKNQSICCQCQYPIYKLYLCNICRKPIHFTCCIRKVYVDTKMKKVLTVCLSCERNL